MRRCNSMKQIRDAGFTFGDLLTQLQELSSKQLDQTVTIFNPNAGTNNLPLYMWIISLEADDSPVLLLDSSALPVHK